MFGAWLRRCLRRNLLPSLYFFILPRPHPSHFSHLLALCFHPQGLGHLMAEYAPNASSAKIHMLSPGKESEREIQHTKNYVKFGSSTRDILTNEEVSQRSHMYHDPDADQSARNLDDEPEPLEMAGSPGSEGSSRSTVTPPPIRTATLARPACLRAVLLSIGVEGAADRRRTSPHDFNTRAHTHTHARTAETERFAREGHVPAGDPAVI